MRASYYNQLYKDEIIKTVWQYQENKNNNQFIFKERIQRYAKNQLFLKYMQNSKSKVSGEDMAGFLKNFTIIKNSNQLEFILYDFQMNSLIIKVMENNTNNNDLQIIKEHSIINKLEFAGKMIEKGYLEIAEK